MTQEEVQEQQKIEQEKQRQALQLRKAALTLAEDQHGNDDDVISLKHAMDDAQHAQKKFQDELRALQLDTQAAKAKYEQHLEQYIDEKYRLSEADWNIIFKKLGRNVS